MEPTLEMKNRVLLMRQTMSVAVWTFGRTPCDTENIIKLVRF